MFMFDLPSFQTLHHWHASTRKKEVCQVLHKERVQSDHLIAGVGSSRMAHRILSVKSKLALPPRSLYAPRCSLPYLAQFVTLTRLYLGDAALHTEVTLPSGALHRPIPVSPATAFRVLHML